jgi:hypothetical protein
MGVFSGWLERRWVGLRKNLFFQEFLQSLWQTDALQI